MGKAEELAELGFVIKPFAVTVQQERELVGEIMFMLKRAGKGRIETTGHGGRSKVLRVGWAYGAEDKWLGGWPPFEALGFLNHWLKDCNSVSINEYRSGDGIAPHIDSSKFAERIEVLNLNSDTEMNLISPWHREITVNVPRRSVTVMTGEIRYHWKHGIRPRRFPGPPRYSVVFRERLGVKIPLTSVETVD